VAALPEPLIRSHLAEGRLMALLPDWGRLMPGVFLYHPSRRQVPMALQVLIRFMQTWRKSAWSGAETPLAAAPLAAAPLDVRA
jgi:DNA-binding transcriptional LysR family regulator